MPNQKGPTPGNRLFVSSLWNAIIIAIGCAVPAIADVDFTNSGSKAAQEPFQRGVAALHSFWWDEAIDNFREAQRIDPDFAMAYWGEAMAHDGRLWRTQDRAAGQEALKRLAATARERRAKAPTAREKGFLEGAEILFFGTDDMDALAEVYRDHMAALHAVHPDDVEVASFYALSILGSLRLGRDFRGAMRAAAILEPWFDRRPRHPGVLHFLIHAYDDPVHAPLGLRAARIYAGVEPSSPHALHMPSHIFNSLGMWEESAASNADAYAASLRNERRKGLDVTQRDFHSLSWQHYALLQMGQVRRAREILDEMAGAMAMGTDDYMRQVWASMATRHVLETASWSDAEALLGSAEEQAEESRGLVGLGLAAAALGQPDEAASINETLAELARRDAAGGNQRRARTTAVHARIVEAMAARARGRQAGALELLEQAADEADEAGLPVGPPRSLKPPAELLGEVYLDCGEPAAAKSAFERSLDRTPRRAASLLGLARAYDALGEREAAAEIWAELATIWRHADEGLPGREEARRYASSSTASASTDR